MSPKLKFCKEVSKARKQKALTQEKAAECLSISVRWFQQIEEGHKLPSGALMLKFIIFFEIDSKNLKE